MPTDARRALARGWLWLGLLALIGSGLFSVLLVLSRTPGLNRLFPVADFFRVALVVHVDLSVLVWFIALAGMLWSLHGTPRRLGWGWAALGLCGAGAALMSLAPFLGSGEADHGELHPDARRRAVHRRAAGVRRRRGRAGAAQPARRAQDRHRLRRPPARCASA